MIVVDTINGALLRGPGISGFSQAVKVLYLILLVAFASHSRSGVLVISLCILTNAIFILVHAFPQGSFSSVAADAQWLLRFNMMWLSYHAFKKMVVQGRIDSVWIGRCFAFVSIVLALNLILGTLGFGYSQYGKYSDSEQIGAVGFIFAGNEMSFLIILCQVVVCGMIYHSGQRVWWYILVCSLFLLASVLKATKVSIIGSILVSLAFPAIEVLRGVLLFRMSSLRGLLVGGLALFFVVISAPFIVRLIESTGLLGRMKYFLNEHGYMFVIFSGRDQFLSEFLSEVWARYSFVEYLFGVGCYEVVRRLGHWVEIDAVDIVAAFGFIGLLIYYGPFLYALVSSSRALINANSNLTIAFVLSFILLVVSLTAGHVIYSGLAAPYLGIAFGFLLNCRDLTRRGNSPSEVEAYAKS